MFFTVVFKKKSNKIDLMLFLAAVFVILFFIPVFLITIKAASPYVRADDWRFVYLYLEPLFAGDFELTILWSDPVHPMPIYAFLYVLSAKLFNLQIHYIAWLSIFFQLLLGYLILKSVNKSFKNTSTKSVFLITAFVGISTYIFSFIDTQAYLWPIMTTCFVGLVLVYLAGYYTDHYLQKSLNRQLTIKEYLVLGVLIVVSTLLFSDWTFIFGAALLTVIILIIILNRTSRKKSMQISIVVTVSLIIGYIIMSFLLIEKPRGLHCSQIGLHILRIENLLLTFKSIALGQFSGVINYKWLEQGLKFNENAIIFLALIFMFTYLFVLAFYFYKKLYLKSILPPSMMLFSLYFLISVLIFRYNPIEEGMFCMVIPRYVMFYQIGIIGFIWGFYLLITHQVRNSKNRIMQKSIIVFVTVLLIGIWMIHFRIAIHKVNSIRSKYPEVSRNIRLKLHDPSVKAWWSNQPGRDINWQLKFLHQHKLNVFAPNYPYPKLETINEHKKK